MILRSSRGSVKRRQVLKLMCVLFESDKAGWKASNGSSNTPPANAAFSSIFGNMMSVPRILRSIRDFGSSSFTDTGLVKRPTCYRG